MRRPTPSPPLPRALLSAFACILALLSVAAPVAAETTLAGEVTERGNPEFQLRMLRDTIDAFRRCNADPVCREKKRVGWRP